MIWLNEINSIHLWSHLILGKREIRPTAFSFLRVWLSGWKNSEVILSHTTNQLHFDKQLLHNFTLDRNIMIHKTTNMPARSGCGLIKADQALLGGYKWRHYIRTYKLTINTEHDITNTGELIVFVESVRAKLNHEIIQNSDTCIQCSNSVPKQKLIIIQNWQCSRWCMVETHISE